MSSGNSWSCDACGFEFDTVASSLRRGGQVKPAPDAEETADYCQTLVSSGTCKVKYAACLRAHLDVVLRKLIPKLDSRHVAARNADGRHFPLPGNAEQRPERDGAADNADELAPRHVHPSELRIILPA